MKLNKDWITEKHIDFEYKKYVLLAYLQHVSENFEQTKLYPYMAELVEHYRNIMAIKESKGVMFNSFPTRMESADLQKFKLIYNKIVEDDEIMQTIENIIEFSVPCFEKHLAEGKKVYEFIEDHIFISPVGISPLNTNEGYFVVKNGDAREVKIYEYRVSFFEELQEKYRSIRTQYICSYTRSLSNTFESIKTDLLRANKSFPNPATYAVESDLTFPAEETLLPVAKRVFIKYLATC